ncbi:uncharacterized protein CEXT_663391 [Caerostris extrusa]|uniref:Uncharacterized protein n=1 Tax=Caerostris extrusa TaxID=172846 RepID=A0AAV4RU21_CAEEX|nr:uncharacterized protein CEXT_663391 [Caerostris extrusa]
MCNNLKSLPVEEVGNLSDGKLRERGNSRPKSPDDRTSTADPSPDMAGNFSNDVLELNPSSNEMKCITEEENQSLLSIEEVSKDLPVHEKDSDLLELEMRARAIRSLLKAKSEDADPEEPRENEQ